MVQSDVFIVKKIKLLCPEDNHKLCMEPPGSRGYKVNQAIKSCLPCRHAERAQFIVQRRGMSIALNAQCRDTIKKKECHHFIRCTMKMLVVLVLKVTC